MGESLTPPNSPTHDIGEANTVWHVRRYIIEHYEVRGETPKEALSNLTNPYAVEVTKETAGVVPENSLSRKLPT